MNAQTKRAFINAILDKRAVVAPRAIPALSPAQLAAIARIGGAL